MWGSVIRIAVGLAVLAWVIWRTPDDPDDGVVTELPMYEPWWEE